jgi:hypothetical protein
MTALIGSFDPIPSPVNIEIQVHTALRPATEKSNLQDGSLGPSSQYKNRTGIPEPTDNTSTAVRLKELLQVTIGAWQVNQDYTLLPRNCQKSETGLDAPQYNNQGDERQVF